MDSPALPSRSLSRKSSQQHSLINKQFTLCFRHGIAPILVPSDEQESTQTPACLPAAPRSSAIAARRNSGGLYAVHGRQWPAVRVLSRKRPGRIYANAGRRSQPSSASRRPGRQPSLPGRPSAFVRLCSGRPGTVHDASDFARIHRCSILSRLHGRSSQALRVTRPTCLKS